MVLKNNLKEKDKPEAATISDSEVRVNAAAGCELLVEEGRVAGLKRCCRRAGVWHLYILDANSRSTASML